MLARLVPGWVVIFGRVNYLGAKPGTQAHSAGARPLWAGRNEYMAKRWESTDAYCVIHWPISVVLQCLLMLEGAG